MRFKKPHCPVCGEVVFGTVDKVVAEVENYRLSDGKIDKNGIGPRSKFEYNGDTNLDTQETITNEAGESLVTCENSHEWYTVITGM